MVRILIPACSSNLTRECLWPLRPPMSWVCLLKAISFTKTQVANRKLLHKTLTQIPSQMHLWRELYAPSVGGTSCALRKAIHLVVALMYFGYSDFCIFTASAPVGMWPQRPTAILSVFLGREGRFNWCEQLRFKSLRPKRVRITQNSDLKERIA